MIGALKGIVPDALRSLRWRYSVTRDLERFRATRAGALYTLAKWTVRDLLKSDVSFRTRDGTRFVTMPSNLSSLIVCFDNYRDRDIQTFIEAHVGAGATFVDAGANVGTYAMHAAKCVTATGRVIAIEAHPVTFGYLARNIALNARDNVTAINVALGAQRGRTNIQYVGNNPGESHVVWPDGDARETSASTGTVELRTLDDVLAELGLGNVDYLKIDVEGFELSVLEGAQRTIASSPGIVVQTELVEKHARRYGHSISDVARFLASLGLQPSRVGRDGRAYSVDTPDILGGGDVLWSFDTLADRAPIARGRSS